MTTNEFDLWVIVELMGHNRIAGKASEVTRVGVPMLRVEVPQTKRYPSFVKYFTGAALYGFVESNEETVRRVAEWLNVSPTVVPIESPQLTDKLQSAREMIFHGVEGDYYPDDEDDEEDDDWGFHDDGHDKDDDEDDDPRGVRTHLVISMERGETANSKSPMWRCVTLDGERVNVFKHTDAKKDTFHFFAEAGYAEVMEAMKVDDVLTWKEFPIIVNMEKKDGWWNVSRAHKISEFDKPDAPEGTPKMQAAAWAKELLDEGNFVVLDLETTGLNESVDEPVQIGVVAADGSVIFAGLVKPSVLTHPEALAVHEITEDMLKDAPAFADIREKLRDAIGDKRVIVYNANFDKSILHNANGDGQWEFGDIWECAMEQYAAFYGERWTWRSGYKPQSLRHALEQQGVEFVGTLHSAVGDCQATVELIKKMAAYEEPKTVEQPF